MIKLTMDQLMNSVEVIQKLINSPTPLSAKVSYQIIRIAREVESEYNLFQKSRTELIEKYAKKDENQKPILENDRYQIVPDEQEDFTKEYNTLSKGICFDCSMPRMMRCALLSWKRSSCTSRSMVRSYISAILFTRPLS